MEKKKTNTRTIIVGVAITLLFFLLISRTFYIQAIDAPMLKQQADNIWQSSAKIDPKRGTIFDRNGERLAHNSQAYTVVAILSKENSNHVTDPNQTASKLAPILDMKESTLYSLLTKDVYQVELRPGGWKIDNKKAEEITNLNLPGIILKEETKRYYPNNDFAAYVLGFTNYDNEAVLGIEKQYNEILSGEPGEFRVKKDLKGYELPDGEGFFQPAVDGSNVVLTIDKTIQQYVESALDKAEAMYNPKRMIAIVADPNTGEILAMSNRPNYNPNEYWNIKEYQNYSIGYQFEPGSTFKIITLAAAIEEKIFDENATFQSGSIQVPGKLIKDHNNGQGWGEITFLEGVQRSSNVAFVLLGNELGKERLYYYIDKFGFGKKTGIDLPGEAKGIVKDAHNAYPVDIANMSFGQGIAITPIQQLMAVSAVANGGELLQPYIVKETRDSKTNELISQAEPITKGRVISEETSQKTREILEEVVIFGQQKSGYLEGYHVAGKTGTSQKLEEDGTYSNDKSIASFIGFAPADDPKLIVYVIVDEPDLSIPYYGSTIAVPIFNEIMQNSLRYLKVPIDVEGVNTKQIKESFNLDNYINKSVVSTKAILEEKGLNTIVIGDGNTILEQYPRSGSQVIKDTNIYLVTVPKAERTVPDFTGMSLRDALDLCYVLDIDVKVKGSGMVIKQNIKPGSKYVDQKLEITLDDPKNIFTDAE